jgi:hypothetical protein
VVFACALSHECNVDDHTVLYEILFTLGANVSSWE